MTEKIIIDGINVSECCFYNNSKCDNPNGMACNCINNAVCYFKEFKRLEQKYNEVLKLSKEGMDAQEYCLHEDDEIIKNLKKENEELKDYAQRQENQRETYYKEFLKIRQTLEEIREIADKMYSNDEDEQTFWYKKINELIDEVLK